MSEIKEVRIKVIEISQPIGRFYIGVMSAGELLDVSFADMRKIEGDLDQYVGIQRQLKKDRVREIANFVRSIDATFPTSVVLAVKGECAEYLPEQNILRIHQAEDPETGDAIPLDSSASILDGQHRVEGLREANALEFQVPVSVFVDADIADQAYIFATVNLAQTKVNKSLVYDLLDYATARSPQKSAHDIVVALDRFSQSPFYKNIKRLGAATPGRSGETLAQATVVNGILPFISKYPEKDRYSLAKGKRVSAEDSRYDETPFRALWVAERDAEIAKQLIEYFDAVREKWPVAWASRERGGILPRTNGYRAFIRLLKNLYLREKPSLDLQDPIVGKEKVMSYLQKVDLEDADFNSENFAPGATGETALYRVLRKKTGV